METSLVLQQKKEKRRKKLFIILIGAILFLFIGVFAISIIVGFSLTKPMRDEIEQKPEQYGLTYEEVEFNSLYDGTLLKGWWIPAQKDQQFIESTDAVVFAHGYGDNRSLEQISVLKLAKRLANEGFNVLVFDFRASGESEGDYTSIGLYEKDDLLSAIQFTKEQKQAEQVHLIGWSMGSVAAILAGVESKDVSSIIADSPFANLREYLETNLPYWSKLPSFPFTNIILGTLPVMLDIDVDKVSPVDSVKQLTDKRLLLITSKSDPAIPYENSQRIYEAVPNKDIVQFWLTESGGHIESYLTNEKEYEEKVLQFLRGL